MESGDGLIVRVRPRAATLTLDQVRNLAAAAQRFGNGHIDLTRRANLQIRGVTADALPGLQAVIESLGLLDASPEAEAVRNIMVSPLAGIDPSEGVDVRPIARALERLIASERELWCLPPKFSFVIDGGGALSLAGQWADVRLEAHHVEGRAVIALAIDQQDGWAWLGISSAETAPHMAIRVAHAFVETQASTTSRRLRDVSDDGLLRIRQSLEGLWTYPLPSSRRRPGSTSLGQSGVAAYLGPRLRGDDASGHRHEAVDRRSLIGPRARDSSIFAIGVAAQRR
jgi:precorrin-3B synthase